MEVDRSEMVVAHSEIGQGHSGTVEAEHSGTEVEVHSGSLEEARFQIAEAGTLAHQVAEIADLLGSLGSEIVVVLVG